MTKALRSRLHAEKTVDEFVTAVKCVRDAAKLAAASRTRKPDILPALAVFDDPRAGVAIQRFAKSKVAAVKDRAEYAQRLRANGLARLTDETRKAKGKVTVPVGVAVPRAYRELAATGLLRYGKDLPARIAAGKHAWLGDVEWLPDKQLAARDDGLVPFAQNRDAVVFVDETGKKTRRARDLATWLRDRLLDLFTWNADPEIAKAFVRIATAVVPHTPMAGRIAVLTPAERDEL